MSAQSPDGRVVACRWDDLKSGEMKCVLLPATEGGQPQKEVLVLREGDTLSAVGARCTHYNVPLVKGVLNKGRLRCLAHGACFNAHTGDIEDFPGLNSLPSFKVSVEQGEIVVYNEELHRDKKPVKYDPSAQGHVLIIGAGPAGLTCAKMLRLEGFKGRITIATDEPHLPYDRTKLSKTLGGSPNLLMPLEFYESNSIQVLLHTRALKLSPTALKVHLENTLTQERSKLEVSQIVIATGTRPRTLTGPLYGQSADESQPLTGVLTLRTPEDSSRVLEMSTDKDVVIVGSSFIGMEVAAALSMKAKSVTVVSNDSVPFKRVLGEEIGALLMELFKEKGISFRMNTSPKKFIESNRPDKKVSRVELADGTILSSDVVILGIGGVPNTDFLTDSGVNLVAGRVDCNAELRSSRPGIYAAGDVAYFPFTLFGEDEKVFIEHWQVAHAQGKQVALSILGKQSTVSSQWNLATGIWSVPFFWTNLFGTSLRYCGQSEAGGSPDEVLILEPGTSPSAASRDRPALRYQPGGETRFVAFYLRDTRVVAAASMNYDPIVSLVAEVMLSGRAIYKSNLLSDEIETFLRKALSTI